MTLSVVARCPDTGQLGVALVSSAMAMAARAAFVRARVGAVAVQGACDPRLGPAALDMLAGGYRPEAVVRAFGRSEDHFEHRQLAIVDGIGAVASHSPDHGAGLCAVAVAPGCVAIGDRLADARAPARMAAAWQAVRGTLADRLLAALRAAPPTDGGDVAFRAAGLLVAEQESWPLVDLRVDWSEAGEPVAELERLWQLWRPQMREHVGRALDPAPAMARSRRA
jgi:uncharacterized Ntn-hydrolase superfamily protein